MSVSENTVDPNPGPFYSEFTVCSCREGDDIPVVYSDLCFVDVWWHSPSKMFEILVFENAFPTALRSILLFCLCRSAALQSVGLL